MKLESLKQLLETRFANKVSVVSTSPTADGARQRRDTVTLTVERDTLCDLVAALASIGRLHIACSLPAVFHPETLELIYPLTLFAGQGPGRETIVVVKTHLPAEDLSVATLSGILPGAQIMEREAQELLGITVKGLPDASRMFTPELPEGVFPHHRAPEADKEEDSS